MHLLLLLLSRFSRVRLCATPQTAAHQAPPSMGFSRQESWSGVPLPFSSNALELSPNHPPQVWGKTVFHETGPWCQKGWGPLYRGQVHALNFQQTAWHINDR